MPWYRSRLSCSRLSFSCRKWPRYLCRRYRQALFLMDSENGQGMTRARSWAGGGCGRLRPGGSRLRLQAAAVAAAASQVPAGEPRPRRSLSPGRPLHARSGPGIPQGDPITCAAPLALGLARTRRGGVSVTPSPGASEGVLVGPERGCKRSREETERPEAGAEADTSTAAARRICCHPRGALPTAGRYRRVRETRTPARGRARRK